MARLTALLVALVLASPALSETAVPVSQSQIALSFAPVVKTTTPAVVNIYTKRVVAAQVSPFANDPFFGNLFRGQTAPRVQNALGSGVILSPEGIVVTNYHVAGQADEIRVVLHDRREFDARVLLADEEADLAILKLDGAADLPALTLRDSDAVEVGDLVLAIGNPFGIGQTVSSGIVSGLARSGISAGSGRGYFIQTDAAINPGNSGGALVDTRGRLVGINTAILSRSGGSNGIGFAIPANLVRRFVEQAEAGKTRFERPWAGLTGQAVDASLAAGLGMGLPRGVAVTQMNADSPFGRAGVAVGDVILSMGGTEVNSPQEMLFRMAADGIGGKTPVTFLHDGAERQVSVALVTPPEVPAREPLTVPDRFVLGGLSVVNINPAVAAEHGLPVDASGVLVTETGDVAAQVGLRAGDILLQINRTGIDRTSDVARAAETGDRGWQIIYQRDGKRRVLRFRV
ncbi:MAG: trypsin-like peptidase domain-containing protein [Paracoccaceae bacterium]